jgi:hypothetical protein
MNSFALAQLGPSDDWMPFVLGAIMFLIPIVAILTRHQQKMALILRDNRGFEGNAELASLRAEVARLTQAVHQQTIALDNLSRRPEATPVLRDGPPEIAPMRGR